MAFSASFLYKYWSWLVFSGVMSNLGCRTISSGQMSIQLPLHFEIFYEACCATITVVSFSVNIWPSLSDLDIAVLLNRKGRIPVTLNMNYMSFTIDKFSPIFLLPIPRLKCNCPPLFPIISERFKIWKQRDADMAHATLGSFSDLFQKIPQWYINSSTLDLPNLNCSPGCH